MKKLKFHSLSVSIALLVILFYGNNVQAESVIIDFSSYGSGKPFDPLFFHNQGITFPTGYFVGFVQGQPALVSTGDANNVQSVRVFASGMNGLMVFLAPASQGSALYTISAFDSASQLISSYSLTYTEPPFGYFTISELLLSRPASSFLVESRILSSPTGINTMEFGVSRMVFTPVPEPGTLLLSLGGSLLLGVKRRKSRVILKKDK